MLKNHNTATLLTAARPLPYRIFPRVALRGSHIFLTLDEEELSLVLPIAQWGVWDLENGEQYGMPIKHGTEISSFPVTRDGRKIISVGVMGKI